LAFKPGQQWVVLADVTRPATVFPKEKTEKTEKSEKKNKKNKKDQPETP
jgi:hypothetical protein